MRELRQDWRDIFSGFRVAFDVYKLLLAFVGVVVTFLVLWGLSYLAGWVIALIVAGVLFLATAAKFALSDTGFTFSKLVMLALLLAFLAGLVLLSALYKDPTNALAKDLGILLVLLVIWAFFGGAITRSAAVEIATDDRIGFGEAAGYACQKYGAYLGATVFPIIAILFLALCCALFGLVAWMPVVDIILTVLFFFLVPIAGFLMFLIGLGGIAGAPLMYPAVSAEGNDSFDAISRSYSYVFGRPWRYIFYNVVALVYGVACAFFVAFFVRTMLNWSLTAVSYGNGGMFAEKIIPRLKTLLIPLNDRITEMVNSVGGLIGSIDFTGFLTRGYDSLRGLVRLQEYTRDTLTIGGSRATMAVLIAICLYTIVGLVVAYVISLFFSLQTTIYLLLRKNVDGAEMTEIYRDEDEEDYLSVTPDVPAESSASDSAEEGEGGSEETKA